MSDPLRLVWALADLVSPKINGDEALQWSAAAIDRLTAVGLIQKIESAEAVTCDTCGLGHVEDVLFVKSPEGSSLRAYISCPDNGRVWVPLDRLRQWKVNFDGIASALAAAFNCTTPEEIVPSRIWFVGKTKLAGRSREIFLACGLGWPDHASILQQASRLKTSGASVILVPGAFPPAAIWIDATPPVIPLGTIFSLHPSGLAIDKAHMESMLGGDGRNAISSDRKKRTERIRDPNAIFYDVHIEFCAEPGKRHIVRINGVDVGGFRFSDLKFTRLLLLAAARAADCDVEGGGWIDKFRLHGDEKDHDIEALREELGKHPHDDLTSEELKALIKGSGKRDGRIRLAVLPDRICFDESLADLQFIGEQKTKPAAGKVRHTSGQTSRAQNFARRDKVIKKLIDAARKLGVPLPTANIGRGE